MTALAPIANWDVESASAAVFTPEQILATTGDTAAPFALASVSKALAAIATLVAVEEGTVTLDDAAGPPGSTVRHLLAHASGLAPDGEYHVLGPPEHRRIYSNLGFETVAGHVAAASGMPFADYVQAALVDALALTHTDVSGSAAHEYRSSVDDVARVVQAVTAGALLAPETLAAMTAPAFPDLAGVLPGYGRQDPNPWGLGVEVRGAKHPHWTAATNAPTTWGHFGRAGTFVWFDPTMGANGVGLVVLTNRDFDQWAIDAWPALADAVVAEFR